MPIVLAAGPGTSSIVAGVNGTALSTDPRVATVAQSGSIAAFVTTSYSPVAELNELVRADPRLMTPLSATTAARTLVAAAFGQTTARWKGTPPERPPPGFF